MLKFPRSGSQRAIVLAAPLPCTRPEMPTEKQARVSNDVFELAANAKSWAIASELLWAAVPEKMFLYAQIYETNWYARRFSASYIQ